ncbi:MAG: DEAD/DEAH box helicase, partial [Alphaproteobacteria bacterium]|nr:DEAD/DEAH box helicase [Alphaproteobacteria bacterium]
KRLNSSDHQADALHGDLQQRRRDRVTQAFRDKKYRILVATDVAARGLDIPHIEHVINYDLPQCPEDYIHRIGRTARAGAEGAAVNLLTSADDSKWRAIHRLMHGASPQNNEPRSPGKKSYGGFKGKSFGNKNGKGGKPPWRKKFGEKRQDNRGNQAA